MQATLAGRTEGLGRVSRGQRNSQPTGAPWGPAGLWVGHTLSCRQQEAGQGLPVTVRPAHQKCPVCHAVLLTLLRSSDALH